MPASSSANAVPIITTAGNRYQGVILGSAPGREAPGPGQRSLLYGRLWHPYRPDRAPRATHRRWLLSAADAAS
jgi:hypothetical protein